MKRGMKMHKTIVKLSMIILLLFSLTGCSMFSEKDEEVFRDYSSAAQYIRGQLREYQTEISFSFRTDDSDDYADAAVLWTKIQQALITADDPFSGEHLLMRTFIRSPYTTDNQNRDKSHTIIFETTVEYYTTDQQEAELEERCQQIIQSLNIENSSDYQKILAIYRYICENITYDYPHYEDSEYRLQYTAYAAVHDNTVVCAGISDLLYCLARSSGLEAHITIYDDHAWNFIKIDGNYYYLDATWDLGKQPGDYLYFLKGTGDFKDHSFIIVDDPSISLNFFTAAEQKYQLSNSGYIFK